MSLAALIAMVELAAEELSTPSLTTHEMARSEVLGLSEVLLYVTDSRAAS